MSKKNNINIYIKKNLVEIFEKFSMKIGTTLLKNKWPLWVNFLRKLKLFIIDYLNKK